MPIVTAQPIYREKFKNIPSGFFKKTRNVEEDYFLKHFSRHTLTIHSHAL